MNTPYIVPPQTHIGHVHLKVASLERSLLFYRDLLGFEITTRYGDSAVFLSAGGYHHHIGLNTWYSENARRATGLGCSIRPYCTPPVKTWLLFSTVCRKRNTRLPAHPTTAFRKLYTLTTPMPMAWSCTGTAPESNGP